MFWEEKLSTALYSTHGGRNDAVTSDDDHGSDKCSFLDNHFIQLHALGAYQGSLFVREWRRKNKEEKEKKERQKEGNT